MADPNTPPPTRHFLNPAVDLKMAPEAAAAPTAPHKSSFSFLAFMSPPCSPLYTKAMIPREFPKKGPRAVQAFRIQLILKRRLPLPCGLRSPSHNPQSPPVPNPIKYVLPVP